MQKDAQQFLVTCMFDIRGTQSHIKVKRILLALPCTLQTGLKGFVGCWALFIVFLCTGDVTLLCKNDLTSCTCGSYHIFFTLSPLFVWLAAQTICGCDQDKQLFKGT